MDLKNIQTFIFGEGSESKDIFLTIDLIPIQVILKYDIVVVEKEIPGHVDEGFREFYGDTISYIEVPEYIDKTYTIDIYQYLINVLCDTLKLQRRDLIGIRGKLPDFDFKTNDEFFEFQYKGTFGRNYYTPVKLRNALKLWEQWAYVSNNKDEYLNTRILKQFENVQEAIMQQGIFARRDWYEISNETVNKFINKLKI